MDYRSNTKVRIMMIVLIVALLLTAAIAAYQVLKKEDPRSASISCSSFFTFSDQALSNDKKIPVRTAVSMNNDLNPLSLAIDPLASQHTVTRLIKDSSDIMKQANQMQSDVDTHALTIPKNACYESLHMNDIADIAGGTNITVYNWVKSYNDYLSRKYRAIHVVIAMNGSAIHAQINNPSDGMPLSGIKMKVTAYTLDDPAP